MRHGDLRHKFHFEVPADAERLTVPAKLCKMAERTAAQYQHQSPLRPCAQWSGCHQQGRQSAASAAPGGMCPAGRLPTGALREATGKKAPAG